MIAIRAARPDDAAAIAAIYAPHVLAGVVSFETQAPDADTMRARMEGADGLYPWIVATLADEQGEEEGVIGYAYATQFRDRAAYRWTAENSIYVRADYLGRGAGKSLLLELLLRSEACGFRQMIAVIGGAEEASVRLHASCGFTETGRLHAAGWKHGRWLDNVYMQKALGEGSSTSPE